MKRSDAVNQVAAVVKPKINNHLIPGAEFSSHGAEMLVDMVLGELENLGMKPPWDNAEFQRQARIFVEPEGYAWSNEEE